MSRVEKELEETIKKAFGCKWHRTPLLVQETQFNSLYRRSFKSYTIPTNMKKALMCALD
jgi:hypothetical protein